MWRFIVLVVGCVVFGGTAHAQRFTAVELQYLEAIRHGHVDKARDLAKLGGIDPGNIQGQAAISWAPRGGVGLLYLPPQSYSYLVGELKQSLDAPLWREQRTLFSTMCGYLAFRDDIWNDELPWMLAIRNLEAAMRAGVKTTEWPGAPQHMRARQPLPECLQAYVRYSRHVLRKHEMMRVLRALIDRGADVNYQYRMDGGGLAYPVFRAAAILDADLLMLLVERGARLTFQGGDPDSTCRLPDHIVNPLVRYMPDPRDEDAARVQTFLTAYMRLGGDIRAAGTIRQCGGGRSELIVKTLKQRALDAGQLTYARMVQELEENAPPATRTRDDPKGTPPAPQARKAGAPPAQKVSTTRGLSGSRMLTKSINLRDGAGLDGVVVGKIEPGVLVSVERMDGDWAFVTLLGGKKGWMHADTLRGGSHHVR